MKKQDILKAFQQGHVVCHGSSRNVVKMNNKGILYVTDHRTNMPYELLNSHFDDCFVKGA